MAGWIYMTALFWIAVCLVAVGMGDAALHLIKQPTITDLLRGDPQLIIWPIMVTLLFWTGLLVHLFLIE
jgi:hypothetical protein